MDLVTRTQIREMDRRTIEGGFVSGLTLMERAGEGILRSLLSRRPDLHRRRIVIVCGRGNNGGDGLVLARLLRRRGLWPRVLLTVPLDSLEGDAAANARSLQECGVLIEEAGEVQRASLARLGETDLIVDAVLGTGLVGPARGPASAWISAMNSSPAPVMAVDIPSGLTADGGAVEGEAIAAEWTATMAFPKVGFLFCPARELVGDVDLVDIGIPETVRSAVGVAAHLPEVDELRSWLPSPGPSSHKGDWGKLLIVGGSPGLTGAPTLAARAALRLGTGLVRVGLPQSLNSILENKLTHAMTIPLPDGEDGQLLAAGAERLLSGFGDWNAMVLGPGLGRFPETERLVMRLLGGWKGPILIDADGLSALAKWGPDSWVPRAREIRAADLPGGAVLTPHLGEMSRLTGRPINEFLARPLELAKEWAVRWGVTLVLKGAPTVTASPQGEVWINPSGNSALAKGGSGDVLSGVIGAFLCQGLSGPKAAVLGSFLHGLSADLLSEKTARRSVLPGEVAEELGSAVKNLEQGAIPRSQRWRRVG